jgi:serine/threonine-protein kinase
MSEKAAGTSNRTNTQLDQTIVPEPNAEATPASKETHRDMEATFVPLATSVPASASQSKPAESQSKKSSSSEGDAKKSTSSLLGKYKLLKKLGQGGMGEVYLGEDTKLGRKAAVKVLSKALAGKEDFVTRFYKEARAMARVNHDNAVSVYDVDQERGIHYVAMEFVDGKSMQKWMDSLGKLSVGDAIHVTLRCAEALQFAHSQNLIHRDIKPDNIMLTSKGKVKVADFGLAKATDDDLSMTASGQGLGTPYYMAPEQARNAKHVDGRTDVYALGVTLYYFLTGKLPFAGNSALEVIMAKEKGQFESARKLNPQVPDRLDLVIGKMVDKDLERRFKDCGEVIKMLAGLGLENPSLSFIDAPDKVVQTASSSASHASHPNQQTSAHLSRTSATTGAFRTSAEDAASHEPAPDRASATVTWIVQFKTPQGKDTIGKFTTAQILTALRNGTLDVKARLKKTAADTFAPIGFFPEFEKAVEGRNIRAKAEQKSAGLKSEFEKIGRQYDRRGWTRWFRNLISGTAGFLSLIIWLAIIAAVIGGLYFFFPTIWDTIVKAINSRQGK